MLRFELLQNNSKLITFFKKKFSILDYLSFIFKCSLVNFLKVKILSFFFFRCSTLRLLLMSQKYLTSVVEIRQELR